MDNKANEYYTIDLIHIVKVLWKKAWAIILAGLIAASIGLGLAAFIIPPTYASSILLYVNNTTAHSNTSTSISTSDIAASQSLVKTYGEILNNRTTLEKVIELAEVDYTYEDLSEMIAAAPSNNTEVMKVTVKSENPYVSARIANCIAEVLPDRISEIITGASMKVVETAIPELEKVGPSVLKYTVIALILGVLIAVISIVVAAMLDDTVHNEEYVLRTYEYPILAKVPNLLSSGGKQYSYYGKHHKKV